MIETNPFAQGEIRSGNTLTASSNNEEMASAQAPVQEIQAETTISAVTYSAVWLSTRNPMSLTRSMPV